VVIDSDDILANPEALLKNLCNALSISWDPGMLVWQAGAKTEDGVWAPHWYDAVNKSTGFGPAPGPLPDLTGEQENVLSDALPLYNALWDKRLTA